MRPYGDEHSEHRVLNLDRRRRAPFDIEVELLADEPNLCAEWRLTAKGQIDDRFQERDVVRAEGVAPGLKDIESLAALEQNGLLRFVHDELGPSSQLAVGVLPGENVRIAVVLDDRDDGHAASFFPRQSLHKLRLHI